MSEVRLAIDRALSKLIGRFGSTSEVIHELRGALAALDKEEAKQGRPVAVETKADMPVSVEVSPPAESTTDAEPPRKARKGMGGKAK